MLRERFPSVEAAELARRFDGLQYGFFRGCRQWDHDEHVRGEQVVFSGFIDDAKHAVVFSRLVIDYLIQLSQFQ